MLIWNQIQIMLRERVKEYLSFTRNERIGITVLIFIMILLLIIPELFKRNSLSINQEEIRKYELAVSSLTKSSLNDSPARVKSISDQKEPQSLSFFDPNTLDIEGWKLLGLNDHVIQTIDHYRKKGGHFKRAEDLKKVYGFTEEKYKQLIPFILIKNEQEVKLSDKEYYRLDIDNPKAREKQKYALRKNNPEKKYVDVNRADSLDFLSFRGIGPKLAGRIVHFREKLGGFYSIDQIAETYGLPDSVFRSIKTFLQIRDDAKDSLKKIDINICDYKELSQHPYIRYALARTMIEFRNQHGPFVNLQDLEKLHLTNREILDKVMPYLKIQGSE